MRCRVRSSLKPILGSLVLGFFLAELRVAGDWTWCFNSLAVLRSRVQEAAISLASLASESAFRALVRPVLLSTYPPSLKTRPQIRVRCTTRDPKFMYRDPRLFRVVPCLGCWFPQSRPLWCCGLMGFRLLLDGRKVDELDAGAACSTHAKPGSTCLSSIH